MIKDLQRLTNALDEKVVALVDAIEKSDPTSDEYKRLLENFNTTMIISTNISQTLISFAKKAQELSQEKEVKEDVTNN